MSPLITNLIERGLTPRQAEIAYWVANGLANHEVADRLYICEKTVKFHMTEVYKKLGITENRRKNLIERFGKKI